MKILDPDTEHAVRSFLGSLPEDVPLERASCRRASASEVTRKTRSHHRPCVKARLLLAACVFAGDAQPAPLYQFKTKPMDEVRIAGTVPDGHGVELAMAWQTTERTDACTDEEDWPARGRKPKSIQLPVEGQSQGDDHVDWIIWRDFVLPGACGWQLSAVLLKADRSPADLKIHESDLLWDRLAFVCLPCTDAVAGRCRPSCVANTAWENDNSEEPVAKRCKFGRLDETHLKNLRDPPRGHETLNVCALYRGVDVKSEHILRPEQHAFRFTLTDLGP